MAYSGKNAFSIECGRSCLNLNYILKTDDDFRVKIARRKEEQSQAVEELI